MTELEAMETLRDIDTELVAVAQGNLNEIKELQSRCLDVGIAALAARPDQGCTTKSCGTRLHLMVREMDVTRVAALMRQTWTEMVAREGVVLPSPSPGQLTADGDELPCPASGTVAPLVDGACSDCGLQLG